MIFKDALERKAAAGDTSPTVFTAGGSGSGKSTTMPGALYASPFSNGGDAWNELIYRAMRGMDFRSKQEI